MTKFVSLLSLYALAGGVHAQVQMGENDMNEAKAVFIGEVHRIKENNAIQLNLIDSLSQKGFNTIVLESATSFQYV